MGSDHERMEAVLHQLELHQREISGDGYPYGLQLILQALGCATHYSDPIAVLDLDPVIAKLRAQNRGPRVYPPAGQAPAAGQHPSSDPGDDTRYRPVRAARCGRGRAPGGPSGKTWMPAPAQR